MFDKDTHVAREPSHLWYIDHVHGRMVAGVLFVCFCACETIMDFPEIDVTVVMSHGDSCPRHSPGLLVAVQSVPAL